MILSIELVPQTSWYSNMRSMFPAPVWITLRKEVYAEFGYKCGICKSSGTLHCHEVWRYDDEKHIQHLDGFIALCELCHHVKHIGFAQVQANRGKLDIEEVYNHFMKVNHVDRATLDAYLKSSFELWRKRSQFQWTIDLGQYKLLIPEGV